MNTLICLVVTLNGRLYIHSHRLGSSRNIFPSRRGRLRGKPKECLRRRLEISTYELRLAYPKAHFINNILGLVLHVSQDEML